ncbi:F-box domain-containing protein [Lentithecium fluviatile CBS 122367]|uniref:F-box domain-containing protein n=1 Tax=Lentithecium fluviatile CBS 122367 TaxID=1168545 RepID=A0A6G1J2F7_9PLEO|nr:F-box domain-containing protein [Lentithecium fluviatile CBS 122367]
MAECHLYKLPNELLLYILTPMTTPQLLVLTVISHRIYALILRILHNRLVAASELDSHSVLLECFHPSAKLTEPPYFCTYRATDGLSLHVGFAEDDKSLARRLGEMRNMYSRFRPHRRELDLGGRRVVRPPGDIPGSRTYPGTAQDRFEGETVKQILSLDGHELFTQLVSQSNLVKIGPRNGLFSCFVEVEEGVVRVWRKWLKIMATRALTPTRDEEQEAANFVGKGKEAVRDANVETGNAEDEAILWVSPLKHTGIRFNVKERKLRRDAPILVRADEEDMPVSYEIEYDELLIRTSHLLLALEKSMVQEDNSSGKAVVFGSFG